jgi:hypothetical protein
MKLMRHILPALVALALVVPAGALAQPKAPRLSDLEQEVVLLLSHKGRLEARLADQVRRIGRLKQNSAGVRRDYQLDAALRQNRLLSDKLSKLQQRINSRTRALAGAYEAWLARPNLSAEQRKTLGDRLTSLKKMLKGPGSRLVVSGKVTDLDSPEDLEEKADLLDDSRDKLNRQLKRVRGQLKQLKHRKRLQRHGRAVDDTPFDESSTSRTVTVRGSSTGADRDATNDPSNKRGGGSYSGPAPGEVKNGQNGNPAPAGPPTGLAGSGPSADDASSAARNASTAFQGLSLHDAISDTELQRALSRPSASARSLEQRIADLELADSKLKKMLTQMDARSKRLRTQANQIRGAK